MSQDDMGASNPNPKPNPTSNPNPNPNPDPNPNQVAWIYRFGASTVVACFEERLVHSLVIRGKRIKI